MSQQTNETLLNQINEDMRAFYEINGRYPTSNEITSSSFRISAKTIHRKFGGLKNLRVLLNMPIIDYSSTNGKPKHLQTYAEQEKTLKHQVVSCLLERFHKSNIHHLSVKNQTKDFNVEIIYADTPESFLSVFNIRQIRKYIGVKDIDIIYVVEGVDVEQIMKPIKHRLQPNCFVIPFAQLSSYIKQYTPYSVL